MELAAAHPSALAVTRRGPRARFWRLFAAVLALMLGAALAPGATPGAAAPAAAKPTAKPGKRGHRRCAAKRARKPRVRRRDCAKSPSAGPSARPNRPAAPAGPTIAADCPDADLLPDSASAAAAAAAAVCLVNVIRHQHGLVMLADSAALTRAARGHADDMVARRYFSHDSLDGRSFADRIFAAGYVSSNDRAVLGENIAQGTGARASAASVVAAWMDSPGHRANILDGAFREAGLWVTAGSPLGPDGATYTHDFGARG